VHGGHLSTSPGRDETRDARPAPLPFSKYGLGTGKWAGVQSCQERKRREVRVLVLVLVPL
jgi:hypothetical protein